MQRPGKIEDVKKKIHARVRKVLQHGIGNFVWANGSGRGEVQRGIKESRTTSAVPSGTWHGGAQRCSLWLCCAESLAEKRKSEISGKRHRPKPIPWERNSWGSLERKKKTRNESQL